MDYEDTTYEEGVTLDPEEGTEGQDDTTEEISPSSETDDESGSQTKEKDSKKTPTGEPQNKYYQNLKNELSKEKLSNSEKDALLSDPDKLKAHIQGLEKKAGVTKSETITDEEIDNLLAQSLNANNEVDPKKYAALVMNFTLQRAVERAGTIAEERSLSVNESQRVTQRVNNEVTSLQTKYTQLNPESPDYDPEVEEWISDHFISRGGYKSTTLTKTAEAWFEKMGKVKTEAKKEANVVIKRKNIGKQQNANASKVDEEDDEKGMSAEQSLAKRMKAGRK